MPVATPNDQFEGAITAASDPSRRIASPFVGRDRELAELRAALDDAARGHGRLFLIVGEAGIGKTRLVEELANEASRRSILVLWGRSWEGDGAPPYWPWIQVIRAYLRTADSEVLSAVMGTGAGYLAHLVPDVRDRVPDVSPPPTSAESDHARFYLFDAVTNFVKSIAARTPLVLVFDDLQWADAPSLLLLQFLAHEVRDARVLVVGTYREAEVRQAPQMASILGGLVRDGHHLPLRGLSEEEVGLFIEQTVGRAPPAALIRAVHRETEGNPFFVDEVVRLLAAEGALDRVRPNGFPVPEGVREANRRRLQSLPATCREILTVASVVGREFELICLQRACKLSPEQLLELLGPALAHGLVAAAPGAPERYRFAHALIREAVYEELPPAERMRLHARIGEVLEELYQARPEPQLAALAHHFLAAAPAGTGDKGIAYAVRAGQQAAASLAYEGAAALYARALQVLALTRAADETERCHLLLALGEMQWRSGDGSHARATFRETAEIARRLGDAALLARSALGFGGEGSGLLWVESGIVDEPLIALLEESLAAAREDLALRAQLLGCLAVQLYYSAARSRSAELSAHAVALARESGNRRVLAAALRARCIALWGPDDADERRALATEMVNLAAQTGDRELALPGHLFRIIGFLERGDVAAVDREMAAWARIASELRQPVYLRYLAMWRVMRATLEGRFAEAEQQAALVLELGRQAGELDVAQGASAQIGVLRIYQGRLEEIVPAVRKLVDQHPGLPSWRCRLAYLYSELGRTCDAEREFAALAEDAFTTLPRSGTWLASTCRLATVCASLRDVENAAILYRILVPYADRTCLVGPAAICLGSVSHSLGELAGTLGRVDDAVRHFEDALRVHQRMGGRPLVASTAWAYARTLLIRGAPADRDKARELLGEALATAEELGMHALIGKIRALDAQPEVGSHVELADARSERGHGGDGRAMHPAAHAPATVAQSSLGDAMVFRRDGEFWTIAYAGDSHHLRDTKGLRYLAYLLRHPGREFHAIALAAAVGGTNIDCTPGGARRTPSPSDTEPELTARPPTDAGALLDARGKQAYRARLVELRAELEEAEAFHDLGRADRARREVDALTHALASAVGLGGRDRKAGSASERARVNLTKTIADALRKISQNNPALGCHLRETIRTGTFFSYTPDSRVPVSWTL